MSEKSRTQCGKPVSENSRIQLEFRDGAAVMMTWQHYLYDGSGQLMAIRYKGADYYYIRDGLMTITGLVDANGTAVVNYRYDSWGMLTGITGSMAGTLGKDNLYRFKGVRSWERYLTLSEEDLLVIQAADDGASVLFGVILTNLLVIILKWENDIWWWTILLIIISLLSLRPVFVGN